MCENNCGCFDDDYPRWTSLFQHYYLGNNISGYYNLTLDRDSHDVVLSEEVTASRTIMATDANFDSYAVSWVGNRLTKWTKNRSEIWNVAAPTTLEFTAAIRVDANFDVYLLNGASTPPSITKYSGVDGSVIWTSSMTTFPSGGSSGSGNGLAVTPDGYSAFIGSLGGEGVVVAFDPDGAQIWLASDGGVSFDSLAQGIFWEDSSSNLWYGAGGFAANATTETVPWLGELNVSTGAIETLYTKDISGGSSFIGDRSFVTGLHTCPNGDIVMSYVSQTGGEFVTNNDLFAMRFANGVTPDPDSPLYEIIAVDDSGFAGYCAIDARSYHFVSSSQGTAVVRPSSAVENLAIPGGDFVSVDGGEPHIFPVHPGS